ncbi:MAG: type II and III secretion system protein, partial [Planctomycetes bacterium]|nr:type II and III secretion system protein [Planctomycetota bacterium]
EQHRLDYGRLERKLQILFPNSKVFLIPLSGKIIVKGQARDASDAARILQIVRNEVINQLGSLQGPQPGLPNRANAAALNGTRGTAGNLNANDLASSYIVNMLEVPGEYQIMLRVRIAEINRSQLRRMGIDLSLLLNSGKHAVRYAIGGLPSSISGIFENGEIGVLVNWLASNGSAKILTEPVITVMSGHTASMLSGGEFAVPTIVGVDGVQAQSTSFRGFGTSLLVTPTVIKHDLIRMRIVPEFSQINQSNSVGGIPGVDTRRVSTTVELREGQTIAIAGLLSHQIRTEVTRIPYLSDIPYIGAKLFAAKKSTMDETELLILVTPEIVRPMDADEVPPVPGFEVTPLNNRELYHYGMTQGLPDTEVYQLAPYGRGAGVGMPVGYRLHNPSPATPGYPPAVTDPYGSQRPRVPSIRRPDRPRSRSRPPNSRGSSPGRQRLPLPRRSSGRRELNRQSISAASGRRQAMPAGYRGYEPQAESPRKRTLFSILGIGRSDRGR